MNFCSVLKGTKKGGRGYFHQCILLLVVNEGSHLVDSNLNPVSWWKKNFIPEAQIYKVINVQKNQLELLKFEVQFNSVLKLTNALQVVPNIDTMTIKFMNCTLVDSLLTPVLNLLVSTITIYRTFSAMNIIKMRLWNKMEDEIVIVGLLHWT